MVILVDLWLIAFFEEVKFVDFHDFMSEMLLKFTAYFGIRILSHKVGKLQNFKNVIKNFRKLKIFDKVGKNLINLCF